MKYLKKMKSKLDYFLNRYLSRKLLVFLISCFGLFSGQLDSSDWVTIAAVYIGSQGVIDAVSKIKNT